MSDLQYYILCVLIITVFIVFWILEHNRLSNMYKKEYEKSKKQIEKRLERGYVR